MSHLERRLARLEDTAMAASMPGIAERLEAARRRGRDPDSRDSADRWRAMLAAYDADVAAGVRINPLRARIANAVRRTGYAA